MREREESGWVCMMVSQYLDKHGETWSQIIPQSQSLGVQADIVLTCTSLWSSWSWWTSSGRQTTRLWEKCQCSSCTGKLTDKVVEKFVTIQKSEFKVQNKSKIFKDFFLLLLKKLFVKSLKSNFDSNQSKYVF